MLVKRLALICLGLALFAAPAMAQEKPGTPDEAIAMVKRAVAVIKSDGKDKTYAAIIAQDPRFKERDLYVVVLNPKGDVVAHAANPKLVGVNMMETLDVDGKPFVKERVELGKANATFWQDYKFSNPVSKKIEPKQMYCEKLDDTVVCGGIYKK